MEHKGWTRRGYLPHCDFAGNLQAITFRLADSLPKDVVDHWKTELERDRCSADPKIRNQAEATLRKRFAAYEDAGRGSCLLRKPTNAGIVQGILLERHQLNYRLIDWCVMPNHVHVLMKEVEGFPLAHVVKRWKAASAIQINRLEKREGRLWMPDYHDRLIRDENHFFNARVYIRDNPVQARLCGTPEEWPFSSASQTWNPE